MDYNIFKSPLRHFIKAKINGGAVLLFVAAAAMIIANTPLRETYDAFFAKEVILSLIHIYCIITFRCQDSDNTERYFSEADNLPHRIFPIGKQIIHDRFPDDTDFRRSENILLRKHIPFRQGI